MVKTIVRDEAFLSVPSEPAEKGDVVIGQDLMDTLRANADRCVGLSGNMIGARKKVIIVNLDGGLLNLVMFNPEIVWKEGPYLAQEGCLSLDGIREVLRYELIEVEFHDLLWNRKRMKFSGWTAEIVQHEMDHLAGILI